MCIGNCRLDDLIYLLLATGRSFGLNVNDLWPCTIEHAINFELLPWPSVANLGELQLLLVDSSIQLSDLHNLSEVCLNGTVHVCSTSKLFRLSSPSTGASQIPKRCVFEMVYDQGLHLGARLMRLGIAQI